MFGAEFCFHLRVAYPDPRKEAIYMRKYTKPVAKKVVFGTVLSNVC
ncbi:hypothetical protein ACPL_8398 [Actinoplanes sp. SE50/110]|nr:hypothetical protein ACPL_8398 [Actinoplanes sp. SE50/110]SLM02931.1 hypothetical protein ACSP50_6216 [Actinoplanes sp. SE50/110]